MKFFYTFVFIILISLASPGSAKNIFSKHKNHDAAQQVAPSDAPQANEETIRDYERQLSEDNNKIDELQRHRREIEEKIYRARADLQHEKEDGKSVDTKTPENKQDNSAKCYWMENSSGKYIWVPAENISKVACYNLDSCSGGKKESRGGCYKWATSPEATALPW